MRPEGRRAAAPALAVLLLAAAAAAAADSPPDRGALSDSAAGRAQAPDSTAPHVTPPPGPPFPFRMGAASEPRAPADTGATQPAGPVRLLETRIDLDVGRKRGVETLASALLGWKPVLLDPLPVFGPALGAVRLPDGGASYRAEDPWFGAEGATDRSLVRLGRWGGIGGLAATLDDPEGTGADVLDDAALSSPVAPGPIQGAADALALLLPRGDADALSRPGMPMPRRFRTTLTYRKGDGDELVTGARFFSPTIGRGLAGSFSRHATGGTASIFQSVSSRHRLTAGLPRWMDHTLSVEGRLFRRTVDMPLLDPSAEARAEMERGSLAVRAASRSGSRSDEITLILRRGKRTDIPGAESPRERWEIPELALQADATWGDSLRGSVLAGIEAASSRVSYRTGAASDFRRRIESARLTLGARRPLGPGGVGADVAYDVTGRQAAEWDARVSAWVALRGAAARLDLESVRDRPTWIDLWTPYRSDTIDTDTSRIVFERSGNPSLRPRRLSGGSGFAALHLGRALRLTASGAAHHVTRDFGWTAEPTAATGLIRVADRALERGDGWISFASLALGVTAGPLGGRAVGWVRGGSDRLAPTAGSPPSRALDAEVDLRHRLFGGDLLARLSAAAHVLGPRRGLIREPAEAVWDGEVGLDFGAAGAVLGFSNVFDRRLGSGVLDVETGLAEPLPGRTFHFGIVWNLLD